MRKNKRYILAIALLLMASFSGKASDFYNNNMVSAEVMDMFRYGDVETSLFTGKLNLSIPIYSLNDPDFNLDIALRYNSEGFKPRKHSGYVGYNWFLEAGGCITREVRGLPDEQYRYQHGGVYKAKGMLVYTKDHQLDKDKVFNFDNSVYTDCNVFYNIGHFCSYDIDYMPDIFHFNFWGYSGSFIINNRGEATIINGDFVDVDLSSLTEPYQGSNKYIEMSLPYSGSQIIITTYDGYKYIFGGDLSSVEYTFGLKNAKTVLPAMMPPTINTWNLKYVVSPNMRKISYFYKPPISNEYIDEKDNLLEYNEYYDYFCVDTIVKPNGNSSYENTCKAYNMTQQCILDSIIISGEQQQLKVCFSNSVDTNKLYNTIDYELCKGNYMLDSIKVIANGRCIKRVVLDYEYKYNSCNYDNTNSGSPSHYWRFLKKVNISGIGSYGMTYNYGNTWPCLYSPDNNPNNNESDYCGFWKENSLQGMLSEIIYPTGGKQIFTFENNYYSKRRYYYATLNNAVRLESKDTSNISISGARIKEIKTILNDSVIETRTFFYKKKHSDMSSGIFYDNLMTYYGSDAGYVMHCKSNYSLLDTHIGYSYVEEYTTFDGQSNKTTYRFYSGPNSYLSYSDTTINLKNSINYHSEYAILSGMLTYDRYVKTYGQILEKNYYENDILKKTENYTYNGIESESGNIITQPISVDFWNTDTIVIYSKCFTGITRKLFIQPALNILKTVKLYEGDSCINIITRNYYDKYFRLKRTTTTNSDNKTYFTRYTYPDEIITSHEVSLGNPYYILKRMFMIGEPIEILSGFETANGSERITFGKINLYSLGRMQLPPILRQSPLDLIEDSLYYLNTADSIKPLLENYFLFCEGSSLIFPYLSRTMELTMTEETIYYQIFGYHNGNLNFNPDYKTICDYKFNIHRRLIELSPVGMLPTSYTWDGIYLTDKTTGNQTWHYTHIPYVGVSSATDPRGITTYYEYDSNGRLIEVYQINNGRKEILIAYQYNIKIGEPHD